MSGRRCLRMRMEAGTASAAAPRARASAGPGRRGKPPTRKTSSSKPASLTSRESALDANPTCAPRDRSASATASAGRTCPAVPPAAIRHLGDGCDAMVDGDVKEDADGGEADDE